MDEENKKNNIEQNSKSENKENEASEEPELEEIKSEKELMAKIEAKKAEDFGQKVLDIARVTRVTKGGKRFTFRAALVIGDGKGRVGFGLANGLDVAQAVEKASKRAKKNLIKALFKGTSIPHEVQAKFNSAVVYLKPAPKGSGVKAGGPVRVIMKLAGIQDVSGKIISRTNNKINIARATLKALSKLKEEMPK